MSDDPRIGVYVCHCGCNIEASVDVTTLSAWAPRELAPLGVVAARDYKFLCSYAGRDVIADDVREHAVTRIVIGGCWPYLREDVFSEVGSSAGVDPSLIEIVPLREEVAWVHADRRAATDAAKKALAAGVRRLRERRPGEARREPFYEGNLVVGGGMAGIRAALESAEAGRDVVVVEREPSIGGYMARLEETFAAPGCLPCLLHPRMIEAGTHPRIRLFTYAEIDRVEGHAGRFDVTIRQKPRRVDPARCDACGLCVDACPKHVVDAPAEAGLGYRKAIYVPFTGAVPAVPVVDESSCLRFRDHPCSACADACPQGAVDLEALPERVSVQAGRILLANSCTLEASARGYYDALRAVESAMGIDFERLADWNRCRAAESLGIGPAAAYEFVAWDGTHASHGGPPPGASKDCAACYLNFEEHAHHADGPCRPDLLDAIARDTGLDAVRRRVARPLAGLRVAPYLGCMARYGGDPEKGYDAARPDRLSALLEALGATVVPFPLATHCCGGHLAHLSPDTALELIRRLVVSAARAGADVLAAICPLCRINVDAYQEEMRRTFGVAERLPIVFFTQLMGLAFGATPEALDLGQEFVSPREALAKAGIRIPLRPEDPMRRPPSRRDMGIPISAAARG